MRQGAADYVAKDNLSQLPMVVERTLVERRRGRERMAADAALARSGRLFEAVFENARDALLILDDERHFVDANPAATKLLGLPWDELSLLRVEDLLPESSHAVISQLWGTFLEEERGSGEVDLLRADGELIAMEYTSVAGFLPARHLVVVRDIRERRAADAEVKRRVAQQAAIAQLGEVALREQSLERTMESAVASVVDTLDAKSASILELRLEEGAFAIRAEHE